MSSPRPAPRRQNRRDSVLDMGGPNSINNFIGSINRSTSFGQFGEYHPADLSDEIFPDNYEDGGDFPVFDEEASLLDGVTGSVPVHQYHPGGSTIYQTTFNAINVLVGMGILSLPLAFRLAGWIPGIICLTLAPLCTRYTAILLGRCLKAHPQLRSYSDIGQYCLKRGFYSLLVFTFVLDLYGASLTLVLLFSDSFSSIWTANPQLFKAFACSSLLALSFLPLAALSFLSIIGIASVTCIILLLSVAGFTKHTSPGSLFTPMDTNIWPESPLALLVGVGIFMAPWGGHVVFPELYRDMRHPHRYGQAVATSYTFAYSIDTITSTVGYLMFGALTLPEITNNILLTQGFPPWLQTLVTICMGILPIAKLPLFILPVVTFFEGVSPKGRLSKVAVRAAVSASLFLCSLYIVDFGRVMSVIGSLICITTCITAPIIFYLLMFKEDLSTRKQYLLLSAIMASAILSIVGTVAAVVGEV